ncbi:PASTA domain-containing protein [Actinokineospora diospyrosa]|uniref:PASTA domain-containing protein n=1 Tax=Actinokineospora diospyrosa TaxID=103728 RepID=A0ABT1I7U6_9PSEU|nr:PASTA domain-containing protein [Actinokineospora diospyrosa]MCP2268641.1 PASTA domain-containing protein [Actinokineospora diospyrosa]
MTVGWPFLVARGRVAGYRVVLAPDFVLRGGSAGALVSTVDATVPDSEPPRVVRVDAELSAVYRTRRITPPDIGLDGDRVLDHAGRPLVLTYGFVARTPLFTEIADSDVQRAWSAATAAYRRFLLAEAEFRPVAADSFTLRSTVTGTSVTDRSPGTPAGSAVDTPATAGRVRLWLLATLITAATTVTISLLLLRSIVAGDAVLVPDVVGQRVADARALVVGAGLKPRTATVPPAGCTRGTVVATVPTAGAEVERESEVRLDVCAQQVAVPALNRTSYAEAAAVLNGIGLVPVRRAGVRGGGAPGEVAKTVPGAGTVVDEGTSVEVLVVEVAPCTYTRNRCP